METKQVIVVRTQYPDGKGGTKKLRTGKLIAQAAHASMSFLTRRINARLNSVSYKDVDGEPIEYIVEGPLYANFCLTPEEEHWLDNSFKKICVYVNSEEELLDIYNKAKEAGLEVHLVEDSGLTEFHGEKTNTCLAIGPHESSRIDVITGHLPLY